MYLFTLILGVVLFPQAHSLNCYVCLNSTAPCTETTQCLKESDQCGVSRTIDHESSKTSYITSWHCLPPELCFSGTMNFGVGRRVIVMTECCNTDLCNKNNPPEPKTTPNGKKCYRCDEKSNCTETLNCIGDENHCFKVTATKDGETYTEKGCATKSMCSDYVKVGFAKVMTLSCCEGDLCNGADGASASVLLLTTMLISICFFSN